MVEVHPQIKFFSLFLRAYVLGAENYKCLKPNPSSPSYCLFSGLRYSLNLFHVRGSFLFSTGVCNFEYFSWRFCNSLKNFSSLKTWNISIVNAKYFYSGAWKRLVSEFEFITFRKINIPSILHFSTLVIQTLMGAELSNEFCIAALLPGHSCSCGKFSVSAGLLDLLLI